MKSLNPFFDRHGFIGHLDENGELEFGDAAQRLGFYHFANDWLFDINLQSERAIREIDRQTFLKNWDYLDSGRSEPVRHHDYTKWYGRSGCFSRDQLIPIVAMLTLVSYKRMYSLFKRLILRGGALWNTKKIGQDSVEKKIPDFIGTSTLAMFLRGICYHNTWQTIFIYWIIFALDIALVFHVLWRCLVGLFNKDNVGDDLNLCVILLHAKLVPTPLSFLSRKLYLWLRPKPGFVQVFGSELKDERGPILAIRWYFRSNSAPPLDRYWAAVIKQEF